MTAVPETLRVAVSEHQAGRLEQAEKMYRQILRTDPKHADALHLLGVIAHQTGRHEAAVDSIRQAIASNPRVSSFHQNLGAAYHALGRFDEAAASYRRALEIDPASAESHNNMGNTLKAQGKLDEAISSYERALQLNSNLVSAHYNLANALASQQRFEEAVAGYQRVLQISPGFVEAHYNLGIALENQNKTDEALASYRRAVQIKPDYVEAHNNLGRLLEQGGERDEAAACYRRALSIQPEYAEAHNNLGTVLLVSGELDQAMTSFRRALSIKPDYAEACNNLGITCTRRGDLEEAAASFRRAVQLRPDRVLWRLRAPTLCPAIFQSSEDIDEYRRRLLAFLQDFAAQDLPIDFRDFNTSGAEPPMNLMYHGRNDRPLKQAYAHIFRNCIPETAMLPRTGRPRIGFVVTADHEPIFLVFMRRILDHWNTDLFDVFVVCTPAGSAKIRSAIRNPAIQVLEAVVGRFDRIVGAILEARFDLLYYWEVGTDPINYFLPFFRLAPVQCTSTGIPATSGIPQMDYYLSYELVETEDSDRYYTESLIRTKTHLVWPLRVALPKAARTRESFGFTADQRLYLCAQRMEKFHPDFDPILAGILRRDASGVVVLVADRHGRAARAILRRFEARASDVANRIVFLPRQAFFDYLGLIAASDVLLDTLYYCGGTTTFHGLCLAKPIVTLPSQFQAGRSTLGCYQKMGVVDCIASNSDAYVDIAVRLGTDPDYRADVEERICAENAVLFDGLKSVRELEDVFQQLIHASRSP